MTVKILQLFFLYFFLTFSSFLQAQTMEDCEKMLIEGVQAMNNKNHSKSLEILTTVQSLAKQNNWPKIEFLATNNIGANYYLMLDYGEALDNYLEAYKIALKKLDNKHEMIVLNNIAILYSKENQLSKAEEYFLKAYKIAESAQDTLKTGLYAINLAIVANKTQQTEKASKYIEIAISKTQNNPFIFINAKIIEADNLYQKKEYKQAEAIINKLLPKLNSIDQVENKVSSLILLSKIYEQENKIKKAIKVVQNALQINLITYEDRINIYQRLSELYRIENTNSLAFAYKDSILIAKDSLNQIKNGKLFENSKIKFELQNYQNELAESQSKLKSERNLFYIILSGILFIIIVVLWALWNYFSRLKQRKIIAENKQKITELELEKQRNDKILLEQQLNEKEVIAQLEQEKFKNEIETKNRQLAAKALSVSTRNELIQEIINSLSTNQEILQNPNLKKSILDLKNQLKKDADWEDFFSHFEEVNHGFLKSLKIRHPDLTSNDLRYISYVYMNLSTKEISLLFNITVEACRKRKERIIKKMNLEEEVDIYSYISTI